MTSRSPVLLFALAVPAALVVSLATGAGVAWAHVGGSPSSTEAGTSTVYTLSVGHGCAGSPTTRLEIKVPEALLSVTPTRNPSWDVATVRAELDEPVTDGHGNEVTDRVDRIVYTAREPLPDGQRDTFELAFTVPDAAGEVLAFPTVQTCRRGENAWVQLPVDDQDPDELESPAPAFEIQPAQGSAPHETDATDATDDEDGPTAPELLDQGLDDDDEDPAWWAWTGLVGGLAAGLAGLAWGLSARARKG